MSTMAWRDFHRMRSHGVVGKIAPEADSCPPASAEPEDPPKIDHGQASASCKPYSGPDKSYRERAAYLSWVEAEIDRSQLAWPTPMCGTPKCLNLDHLDWQAPRSIDYPAGVCVYCGMPANSRDHLLPRTWTGNAVRHHVITVPACLECNSVINDRYAPAVNERRKLAHKSIRRRYSKVLQIPEWTAPEIAKLGKTLRSTIERGMHEKRVAEARLKWPKDPNYDVRAMQRSGIENPYALGLLVDGAA